MWKGEIVGDTMWLKTSPHLAFCKVGCSLVSLVKVFVVNSTVMPTRVFAALDHEHYETVELRIGVVGVVDVGRRLQTCISDREKGS